MTLSSLPPGALTCALCLAALMLIACPSDDTSHDGDTADAVDLVLYGGRIVTLDDTVPTVEALAIHDQRIVAAGARSEVEPLVGATTRVVELPEGALAVPGFTDGHAHFLGLGDMKIQLDLRAASSWGEIVALVAAAAAEAPPGTWIRGRGWHQDKWTTPPEPSLEGFPLHDALSAATPDHPVLLTHASGHALLANAKAMELGGVDASTPDPPGGELLRTADGSPSGLFNETAQDLIHSARGGEDAWLEDEMRRMVELASEEALSKGLTSFHDAGSPLPVVEFLRRAADDGSLGVRLWVMLQGSNDELATSLDAARLDGDDTRHMLEVGGIKRYMDGALGSRGAWLLEPYDDEPTTDGLALSTLDDLRETARLAREHGYQLCVHAIGDRANREVLDLFADSYAAAGENADLRWRIEHVQHLDPADISRFATLGVVASMQPVHATSDGPWVPDRIGDERAAGGAYVWRALLDSGAVIVSGTDAPVEDVDPIANFHAAVTRQLRDGSLFYPEQSLSREEALVAATRDAAWSVFQEADKGRLAVGQLGDVTVLSKDILTVPDDEILDAKVLYTIVGGTVAYEAADDETVASDP
ncbi:MAG: amidohydrolase [Acidobacteriota bacterium]